MDADEQLTPADRSFDSIRKCSKIAYDECHSDDIALKQSLKIRHICWQAFRHF